MIYPTPPEPDPARGRRANQATPVAGAGPSPVGTGADAGGHRGAASPQTDHPRPDTSDIAAGGPGVRLTPTLWYVLAALVAALLLTSLLLSF